MLKIEKRKCTTKLWWSTEKGEKKHMKLSNQIQTK